MHIYERVVAALLLAPLALTLIVMTATFLVAGLRDLFDLLARMRVPEKPEFESIPKEDINDYIMELKKENDIKLQAQ